MWIRPTTTNSFASAGVGRLRLATFFCVCLVPMLVTPSFVPAQEQNKPACTADRHVARGLQCSSCHGGSANSPVHGDKCLTCHQSMDAIIARTGGVLDPNPHDGHVGELECTVCHSGHKADELQCTNCHSSMVVKRKAAAPAGSGTAAK